MQKKSYEKTGEILYTDVLANGLTVYYLPKPDYNRTYGLLRQTLGHWIPLLSLWEVKR